MEDHDVEADNGPDPEDSSVKKLQLAMYVPPPRKRTTGATFPELATAELFDLNAIVSNKEVFAGLAELPRHSALPPSVVFVLCMNASVSKGSKPIGMMRHSWWPTDSWDDLVLLAGGRKWSDAVIKEYSGLTPFQQVRLSSVQVSYLWNRPNTEVMKLRVLASSYSGDGEYFQIGIKARNLTQLRESEAQAEDDGMLVVFMADGVYVSTLQILIRQLDSADAVATVESNGDRALLTCYFNPESDNFRSWANDNFWQYDPGLEQKIMEALLGIFKRLQDGKSVRGAGLHDWDTVFDLLFPGE